MVLILMYRSVATRCALIRSTSIASMKIMLVVVYELNKNYMDCRVPFTGSDV